MRKTKIYIVRHAEMVGNVENRLTGRKDYELTEKGKISIEKLTKELKGIQFDKMYCSTSNRTLKTIQPLAKIHQLKVKQLEELCEMHFGIFDGWQWDKVNNIYPKIKQYQNEINEIVGIPEQESMIEVAQRMYCIIQKLAKENIGKTILICSHGVAIESFLRKIVLIPFRDEREKFAQHNTAINELEFLNDTFHIKQLANKPYNN